MGFLDRCRSQPGVGLTAAATILEPDDPKERTRVSRGPEPWQREALDAYYDLAEVGYPTNYQSNALARLRLVPAMQDDPREPPVVLDDDGDDDLDLTPDERAAMNATIDRLGIGTLLSMTELQRLLALHLFLTGECYLVGYPDPDQQGEAWDVLSVDELVVDQNGRGYARRVAGYGGSAMTESFPDDAFIARLYQRDARYSRRAYSAMRSVLPLTDELRILTDAIRATAASRIPAGILALSHNFRAGPKDERLTGQRDEAANDPTVVRYQEHFETPIKNRKSAAAVTPFLLFGETADIQNGIRPIEFNRPIDKTYADMRAEIIRRIGVGIDLPPEVLTGLGNVKFWNAQMIDQSTFKYHLEPDAQAMVYALTYGYYRPHLAKMGIENLGRCLVWYDATPLVSHPNQSQDYQEAYDRIEVSGDAYRRIKGIPDEDKPTPEERADRIWAKITEHMRTAPVAIPTPEQILSGEIPVVEANTSSTVAPSGPPSSPSPDGPPVTVPASGPSEPPNPPPAAPTRASIQVPPLAALTASAALSPLGPRLANIEKALRLRLLQASDDAMTRALEKAGNKLRSLAVRQESWRAKLSGVDALDVAAKLGATQVAQLAATPDDLLAGAFASLGVSWTTWVRRAQEQGLAAVDQHGNLSEEDAVALKARMDTARDEGQAVFLAALAAAAGTLLYAPHVEAPARGEWSDFRVDPSVVTDALREAGGGTSDTLGTSGLLSGDLFDQALTAAGLAVAGFVWIHGDPARDFEGHLLLDGTEFAGFEDDLLGNDLDWPPVAFFSPNNGPEGPDHDGCTCLAMLQIDRGDGTTQEAEL